MRHRFVAVKLLPRLPGFARFGQKVLPSFNTTPFFALHLLYPKKQHDMFRKSSLFVISSEKPTSPGNEYFVLKNKGKSKWEMDPDAINTRSLTVNFPLPFQETLYLSVTPRICAEFEDSEVYKRLVNVEKYRLDKDSFQRFLEALEEAGPSIPGVFETGGEYEPASISELAGFISSTWSGISQRQGPGPGALVSGHQLQFYFDLIPFESLLKADLKPRIYDELTLLRQLYLDYTREKCDIIIEYIQSWRKNLPLLASSGQIFRTPSVSNQQPLDPSVNALRPSLAQLQSLPIPYDGDPVDSNGIDDWLNEEEEYFDDSDPAPEYSAIPAVKADDIKMIVFDPNVLIDHDGPLQEALVHIFPPSVCQLTMKELLDLYVEHEALRATKGHPVSPTTTIQDIASYLDLSIEDATITNALNHADPHLYPEASMTLVSLIDQGYTLLSLTSSSHNYQTLLSHLPILDTSRSLESLSTQPHPTLRKNQILVVTNNIYRIAEPASVAGFPTALIKRPGSRSADLVIPNTPTTYTCPTLSTLLSVLKNPASAPEPFEPFNPEIHRETHVFYQRIHDCYQVTGMLGSGSFGVVFHGIELNTGSQVAIKFTLDCSPLPYEAAVYAQLKGIPGLPRIHWNGSEKGWGYMIVMDKLGPNLAQLKSFCRGRFSLKTVLMLGEQMLSIIEDVHSRGIIVRDIKPENFAMGRGGDYKRLYLFDLGLSKLWFDPNTTSKHIRFREGRMQIGTARYVSCNSHSGFEQSRRDDIESIGYLLLYLLHGCLPWQGVCAQDVLAKLRRIGKIKSGKRFIDFLADEKTPKCFTTFFEHCRSLAFEAQPDYKMLRELFRVEFQKHGWGEYDWKYDWWKKGGVDEEMGTLIPEEYKLDKRFVEPVRHSQDAL